MQNTLWLKPDDTKEMRRSSALPFELTFEEFSSIDLSQLQVNIVGTEN